MPKDTHAHMYGTIDLVKCVLYTIHQSLARIYYPNENCLLHMVKSFGCDYYCSMSVNCELLLSHNEYKQRTQGHSWSIPNKRR